jgi:hypothetical protein
MRVSADAAGSGSSLEQRVAALEAALLHPPVIAEFPAMSAEDAARFKEEFGAALRDSGHQPLRILPSPPLLTPGLARALLRECVTVVKPGETLVMRGRNWTPNQVREIQEWMDREHESGRLSFKVLAVFGDELAVVQPETDEALAKRIERVMPRVLANEMRRKAANIL